MSKRKAVGWIVSACFSSSVGADTLSVCLDGSCDYTGIQAAIDEAMDGDVIEIAAGTYFLTETISPLGKAITLRGAVNPKGIPLSILDGQDSVRVMICESGETSATVIEDLRITHGWSGGGGGLMNINSSTPTLRRIYFVANTATRGGAMYNLEGGSPMIEACVFRANSALGSGTAGDGGAIYSASGYPTLVDCIFEDNWANDDGAGYFGQVISQTRCEYRRNHVPDDGGAIYGGSQTLIDCVFEDNSAGDGGGAIYNHSGATHLVNCTLTGNASGGDGGAIFTHSNPRIHNSVLGGNTASGLGGGLFSVDAAPRVLNVVLCGNLPEHISGAWEDQGENCMTDHCGDGDRDGVFDCIPSCLADLDGDGIVTGEDIGLLLGAWGTSGGDVNGDGATNSSDLGQLLAGWGDC